MRGHLTLLLASVLTLCSAFGQTPVPAGIFGTNGCADITVLPTQSAFLKSHALQPDGKLLLAGWGGDGFPYRVAMARIDTACGELDPTFGDGGILAHHFQQRTICSTIAVQADGKIVGGGSIAASNAGSGQFPGVFRYNADGSVDSTFNGTGYNNTGFSSGSATGKAEEVFLDPDGRILAAIIGNAKVGVFRYLPDGTLDTTYSANGRAEMPVDYTPFNDNLGAVMDPDGSVTLAALVGTGVFDPFFMGLARFLPNGDPDPNFGTNGLALHPTLLTGSSAGPKNWSMVRRPGGGYLVGLGGNIGTSSPSVAAFTEAGAIDPAYGTDGIYRFIESTPTGSGLWMDPDGSALLFIKHSQNGPGGIVRLTPNGEQDPSFGNNGLLLAPFGAPLDNRGFAHGFRLPGGDLMAYGTNTNAGQGSVVRFSLNEEANTLPVISFDFPVLVVSGGGSAQWFLDGTAINGATTNSYAPTQNGNYTVEMNSFGCAHTSPPFEFLSTDLVENVRTGITFGQDFSAGVIMVRNDGAPIAWSLIDASGRELRSGAFLGGTTELSVAHLRSGLYFLRSERSVHRFVMP